MKQNLESRLAKLEQMSAPNKKYPHMLVGFENETAEQLIEKHLASHPEHRGLEFDTMSVAFVKPNAMDSEVTHAR